MCCYWIFPDCNRAQRAIQMAIPTGKVVVKDGTLGIVYAMLNSGLATLTKSALTVGTHPITAQYGRCSLGQEHVCCLEPGGEISH
jgi:hypothetical protein